MITVTVETEQGTNETLYFNEMTDYDRFSIRLKAFPNSRRLVHGWGRSIMLCNITRVISVEDDRVVTKGRN